MADIFEKYQLAVESTPSAIIIANQKGQIVLVNQQAEKLFGSNRGELMGQPIEILLPERYRSAHSGQSVGFMKFATLTKRKMFLNVIFQFQQHYLAGFPCTMRVAKQNWQPSNLQP